MRVKSEFPEYFMIDNELVSDKSTISNKFNEFYTNIGPNIAKEINIASNKSYRSYQQVTYKATCSLHYEVELCHLAWTIRGLTAIFAHLHRTTRPTQQTWDVGPNVGTTLVIAVWQFWHWTSVWSGHFCDFETYSDNPIINLEGWDIYFPYTTGTHIQYITRIHFI